MNSVSVSKRSFKNGANCCSIFGEMMPITTKEIEDLIRQEIHGWDSHDMEAVSAINAEAIGFGFRARASRDHKTLGKDLLQQLKGWIQAHEYYHVALEELNTSAKGDTGFAWGFHIEDFQMKGQAPEKVRVRFSVVYKKEGGQCKVVFYHRDAQPFDDSGDYVKESIEIPL